MKSIKTKPQGNQLNTSDREVAGEREREERGGKKEHYLEHFTDTQSV